MINKIKTLLGTKNAQFLLANFVRYFVLYMMFRFMNKWTAGILLVVISTIALAAIAYYKDYKESGVDALPDILPAALIIGLPLYTAEAFLSFYTFKYIDLFGIPALAILNGIFWLLIIEDDDEPRTKTTPSDKEATNDENNHMVSEAQDFPAGCDRPDINGDSEVEPEIQFTREEWEEAKKTLGDVDAVVDKLIKKLEEAGYDAWKSVECGHPVKKYFSCTVRNTGEPIERKEGK